jgi:hypothetical protein
MKKGLYRRWLAVAWLILVSSPLLAAQGHLEIGIHGGIWNIDVLNSLIEDWISVGLERGLKDTIVRIVRTVRPSIEETAYSQTISFDSGGSNWGFQLRWYPEGKTGSFSLGFSVEQTHMIVSVPELAVSLSAVDHELEKEGTFYGDAGGTRFQIRPVSYHLLLRWDIFPTWRIRPFITFGLGLAGGKYLEEGKFTSNLIGSFWVDGQQEEYYQEPVEMTLAELKTMVEEDYLDESLFLPPVLPFVQLSLGVKGEITPYLHLLLEAGVFDGIIFRAGLAFRI